MLRRVPPSALCLLCTIRSGVRDLGAPSRRDLEPVSVPASMELKIKEKIFCETVRVLRDVRENVKINGKPSIPDLFGVQMQITLTIDEASALNSSIGSQDILPSGLSNKVTVPQSFALNGAATLSSTATRADTSYSYYNVGKITAKGANPFCDKPADLNGSSPLLNPIWVSTPICGRLLPDRLFFIRLT